MINRAKMKQMSALIICHFRSYQLHDASVNCAAPLKKLFLKENLKVPKCEIFDPFFYTNKSYMGR